MNERVEGGHRSRYDLESAGRPGRSDNLILICDRTEFILLALKISGMCCETHTETTLSVHKIMLRFLTVYKRIVYQKKSKKIMTFTHPHDFISLSFFASFFESHSF